MIGLKKMWEYCDNWLVKCNVQREAVLLGITAENYVKNISFLQNICPRSCLPHVSAFESVNKVVESYYGSNLNMNFEQYILTFKQNFLALNINVTPKVHAIFYHVSEFCKLKKQGLAP
jgi:hypothetical protein